MALPKTFTFTFPSDTFVDSKPVFSEGSTIKGMSYSNQRQVIELNSSDYGYINMEFTFIGTAAYAGISFRTPPPIESTFSIGQDGINGLFIPYADGFFEDFDIKLESNVTKSLIMIVNADPNKLTDQIEFLAAVGVAVGVNPGDDNLIIVNYECRPEDHPLYSYDTGLHVYSPYDSIYSSKLHTFLYSRWPIESWSGGTIVWADATFAFPALQYYYGYGNNVYKVGGPLDRSYGTMEVYNIWQTGWRKLWHKDPVANLNIVGPMSFNHPLPVDTIEACINVIYTKAGIISEIIPKLSLPQPSKYKYYMGYDESDKQSSNDNFFVQYLFSQRKFYSITGYQHVMFKLVGGYIESMSSGFAFGRMYNKWMIPYVASGVASATLTVIIAWPLIKEFVRALFSKGPPTYCVGLASPLPWLIFTAVILISGLVNALFTKRRQIIIEPCKEFLSEYTTTPYIELNSQLSRLQDMSQKNIGYYCDGVYFYTQPTDSGVTVKELSSTNALITEDPITIGFLESLQADNPTTVTDIRKLFLLPYTSGIPLEFGETPVYYSAEITREVIITECAELLITPSTVTYTLPEGYCFSFISQVDADDRANLVANDISNLVEGRYTYGEPLPEEDLGMLDSYFTHEIRVETIPTICSVFYDNRDRLGLIIGRKIFFDVEGRIEAMNGYYATDDNTYFRIFYKVENSFITNKYIMIASNSTAVQGMGGVEDILSVMTNNLSYSSNWYIKSTGRGLISNLVNEYYSNRCFNPNGLYGESYMVRGYYDSVNNHFYLYADNYANYTLSEAPAGWYQPLIEWINEVMFEYSPILSISINIEEICLPQTEYVNALYGFYVIGSSSGNITPLFNEVNLTVDVYVAGIFRRTYTVTTNESGKTYVSYDGYVLDTEGVSLIVITSINGSSPISIVGHITYLIGTFISCSQPPNPFATGLEACWNFEEASAPLLDSTTNNNDLTQTTDVDFQQTGKVGSYCVNLPLATSVASTNTSDTLALQTFSISVWVNCVGTEFGSRTIFSKVSKESGHDSGGYDIAVNPGLGGVLFHIYDDNGYEDNTGQNTTAVNDGDWHHIVATYIGGHIKIYHNTILEVDESMASSAPISYGSTYVPAKIGNSSHGASTYPLKGFVDAIAVWNRVLTPYEVQILYNAGDGLACP
jgi:hypothetical protein